MPELLISVNSLKILANVEKLPIEKRQEAFLTQMHQATKMVAALYEEESWTDENSVANISNWIEHFKALPECENVQFLQVFL